jgi:chorismate mutase
MGSSSKRQTTMAKIARERALQDKRERKQQKKEARKRAAAEAAETGLTGEENERVEEEGGASLP